MDSMDKVQDLRPFPGKDRYGETEFLHMDCSSSEDKCNLWSMEKTHIYDMGNPPGMHTGQNVEEMLACQGIQALLSEEGRKSSPGPDFLAVVYKVGNAESRAKPGCN